MDFFYQSEGNKLQPPPRQPQPEAQAHIEQKRLAALARRERLQQERSQQQAPLTDSQRLRIAENKRRAMERRRISEQEKKKQQQLLQQDSQQQKQQQQQQQQQQQKL